MAEGEHPNDDPSVVEGRTPPCLRGIGHLYILVARMKSKFRPGVSPGTWMIVSASLKVVNSTERRSADGRTSHLSRVELARRPADFVYTASVIVAEISLLY